MHPATVSLATGGLLFRALRRLGAVPAESVKPGRGILLLVVVTWAPLAVLTLLDGTFTGSKVQVSFLRDPAVHARLLVALPLLMLAEAMVTGMIQLGVQVIRDRRLVPDADLPAFETALDRLARDRDSMVVELFILLLVAAVLWFSRDAIVASRIAQHSSWFGEMQATPVVAPAGWWYLVVSLFVVSMMGLRWAWWIFIWSGFVVGFLRPRLLVTPGHPDGHAGLAFFTTVQSSFAPVFAALAATASGRLGYELLHEGATLKDVQLPAVVVIVVSALVMFVPLLLFVGRLVKLKRRALVGYDKFGQHLVTGFEQKWLGAARADEPALGSPDPSSLADFAVAYDSLRQMKPVPLDFRRAAGAIVLVALPFLPLLLTAMSFSDILKRMIKVLL